MWFRVAAVLEEIAASSDWLSPFSGTFLGAGGEGGRDERGGKE